MSQKVCSGSWSPLSLLSFRCRCRCRRSQVAGRRWPFGRILSYRARGSATSGNIAKKRLQVKTFQFPFQFPVFPPAAEQAVASRKLLCWLPWCFLLGFCVASLPLPALSPSLFQKDSCSAGVLSRLLLLRRLRSPATPGLRSPAS